VWLADAIRDILLSGLLPSYNRIHTALAFLLCQFERIGRGFRVFGFRF
jgi:hypothetical protein